FNDPISWGPIMGTGYHRNVTQWSKGDYLDATNNQDDLKIISGKLTYRKDDYGNTNATAAPLTLSGLSISSANKNNSGVIEKSDRRWLAIVQPGVQLHEIW